MRRICCIHQGYELYGSDRTFLACVDFIRERFPNAYIRIILPRLGPLSRELESRGYCITMQPLLVLRKRYGLIGLIFRLCLLPFFLALAVRTIWSSDLVYINTGVIIDYIIAARSFPHKCVIHVHEMPAGAARLLLRTVNGFSRSKVLFNSEASKDNLNLNSGISQFVVHNGVSFTLADKCVVRKAEKDVIQLLMLGRINDWKGQDLLVAALHRLPREVRYQYQARIVGDVFEGSVFRQRLVRTIRRLGLSDVVVVGDFERDPSSSYAACEIVVIPSRKPEPFGMVAIEAMAHGKPVIAARHGGLLEIVKEGQTGWFFNPNDAEDLANVLRVAVSQRQRLHSMGEAGRRRYLRLFTTKSFRDAFLNALLHVFPE
jgi:glycosyltransferase involved in cell wall biosynthesis